MFNVYLNIIVIMILIVILVYIAVKYSNTKILNKITNSLPTDPLPTVSLPTVPLPTVPLPNVPLPTVPLPTNPLPTNPLPTNPLPTNPLPIDPLPTNSLPTNPLPTNSLPFYNNTTNIKVGSPIWCSGYNPKGSGAIYRYIGNNMIKYYPNSEIAASWDNEWYKPTLNDCTNFKLGEDLKQNLPEGTAVSCSHETKNPDVILSTVYRHMGNGNIRGYPTPEIATSWDPYWFKPTVTDCSDFIVGSKLDHK